jgi:hypothetical protein
VDGGGDPQDVLPVPADPAHVDAAPSSVLERAAVGTRVDAPQLLVGEIGELGLRTATRSTPPGTRVADPQLLSEVPDELGRLVQEDPR